MNCFKEQQINKFLLMNLLNKIRNYLKDLIYTWEDMLLKQVKKCKVIIDLNNLENKQLRHLFLD